MLDCPREPHHTCEQGPRRPDVVIKPWCHTSAPSFNVIHGLRDYHRLRALPKRHQTILWSMAVCLSESNERVCRWHTVGVAFQCAFFCSLKNIDLFFRWHQREAVAFAWLSQSMNRYIVDFWTPSQVHLFVSGLMELHSCVVSRPNP